MPLVFDALHENYFGYAAIFACVGVGFLSLRVVDKKEVGPGYWAASFFCNGIGFIFWSGSIPIKPGLYNLIGEIFHCAGFIYLVAGAYRFTGNPFKKWNGAVLSSWIAAWLFSILLFRTNPATAGFLLKVLRSLIFIAAGTVILLKGNKDETIGRFVAGLSLSAWGIFIVIMAFIKINEHFYMGFLAGFQVLAAFGMVAMVIDKIQVRAEKTEEHLKRLEGILPICSYCKKIRDEKNEWQVLEAYIEDRSKAEFSHGICPDCFKKYRPDR